MAVSEIVAGLVRADYPGKDVSHPSAEQPGVPRIPSGRAELIFSAFLPDSYYTPERTSTAAPSIPQRAEA
jgi:hypothetical protein